MALQDPTGRRMWSSGWANKQHNVTTAAGLCSSNMPRVSIAASRLLSLLSQHPVSASIVLFKPTRCRRNSYPGRDHSLNPQRDLGMQFCMSVGCCRLGCSKHHRNQCATRCADAPILCGEMARKRGGERTDRRHLRCQQPILPTKLCRVQEPWKEVRPILQGSFTVFRQTGGLASCWATLSLMG